LSEARFQSRFKRPRLPEDKSGLPSEGFQVLKIPATDADYVPKDEERNLSKGTTLEKEWLWV
jgi:hypothetical protein